MTSPSLTTETIERTYWKKKVYYDDYGDRQENITSTTEEDGELIASLTTDGKHAPALDIDFPVRAEKDGTTTKLVIEGTGPVLAKDWLKLQKALVGADFIRADTVIREFSWMNEAAKKEQFLATLPPLILEVPITLLESTTPGHFHLYIERKISWAKYKKILKALKETPILEDGYVRSALCRDKTFLFKPGFKNPSKKPGFVNPPIPS